ncbi:MAG: Iron-regulated transporter permease protein SufD [Gammaproteobacteria bacterium]|nr:Iron-regulated transporter permease protein SufD [Gammaproteobacteria bacterium]
MNAQASIIRPNLNLFGENLSEISAMRAEAWKEFLNEGWPDRKWEQWKYTDLKKLLNHYHFKALAKKPAKFPQFEVCPNTYQAVLLDGEFCPELSQLPKAVEVMSLQEALLMDTEEVLRYLRPMNYKEQPMAALNQALMSDGLWIRLPADCVLDKPLQMIYLHSEQREPVATFYRNIIVLGHSSALTLIEDPQSQSRLHVLSNSVTQVYLESEAQFQCIGLQRNLPLLSQFSWLSIEQKRLSQARLFNIALGSYIGRYDLHSSLLEPEAMCEMKGIYVLTGTSHTDYHTRVDHIASHTKSIEVYKGVVDQKAHGVFNGKVMVHPNIKAVDARQSNHNLLLSNTAEIDTKPELEIYSDDVKCSHGATIGQLDEQALFYLQSRGIELQAAKLMLTQGFVLELLNEIQQEDIKNYLQGLLEAKMQQHFLLRD